MTIAPGFAQDPNAAAMIILAATMLVNIAIAYYERRRGRELRSELLLADARHTQADVWVTLAVLVGLGLVRFGWGQADAALALIVAIVVAHSGYQILRRTVPVLVDQAAVDANRVYEVASQVEGVETVSGVRSRGRPGEGFAELTVRVHPAFMSLSSIGLGSASIGFLPSEGIPPATEFGDWSSVLLPEFIVFF